MEKNKLVQFEALPGSMIIPPNKVPDDIWDFVVRYYPKYHQCDEIARADDLQKLLDKEYQEPDKFDEDGDCAYKLLMSKYNGDINNPQIQIDYNSQHKYIYERAIEGFIDYIKELKNK